MGFKLDLEDIFEGSNTIKDGWYEVIANRVNENATPGGAEYTEFDLIIRNDIDQGHKNQHIFEKNFKAKATGKYNMKMFNTIGSAFQLEKGKEYGSFDDMLNDFVGKPARVFVKNETSEYNGKTYENLNVKMWSKSKFPDVQHVAKGGQDDPISDATEVSDQDLPF